MSRLNRTNENRKEGATSFLVSDWETDGLEVLDGASALDVPRRPGADDHLPRAENRDRGAHVRADDGRLPHGPRVLVPLARERAAPDGRAAPERRAARVRGDRKPPLHRLPYPSKLTKLRVCGARTDRSRRVVNDTRYCTEVFRRRSRERTPQSCSREKLDRCGGEPGDEHAPQRPRRSHAPGPRLHHPRRRSGIHAWVALGCG